MAVTVANTEGVKITNGAGHLYTGMLSLRPPSRLVADAPQWFVPLPVHINVQQGAYSVALESGLYWLHAPSATRVPIVVPSSGGPFTLQALIEDPDAPPPPDPEETVTANLKFATISELLFADSTTYLTAEVSNYETDDGTLTIWRKVTTTGLMDNGDSVRQTNDNAWIVRIYPA